jgi:hypothetical protein
MLPKGNTRNNGMAIHRDLTEKAKSILRNKGFTDDEIHEEFWFKNYRIDAVGWSQRQKVAVEYGHCSQKKKRDLEKFFDEVICFPLKPQAEPTFVATTRLRDMSAKMRLVLFTDDGVVFDAPLSREDWSKEHLEDEIDAIEQDFQQSSKLFNALSHENRLRMMKLLMENEDLSMGFAEFIRDLGLNPKLVWENTRKLSESGLLEKSENGRYRCSEFGEASFIMLSFVLRHLREMFESAGGR